MNWFDECEKAASELTKEKRQEFLNLVLEGKTIGDARKIAGISFDAANGVIRQNIEQHEYKTLRRVAV